MFKFFNKNKYSKWFVYHNAQSIFSRGFTLIELIVVISIFMILTSITVFNYGEFNSSLSIQNLADDIALTVRKAQGFAIGVRGSTSGSFGDGYGVHFTTNPGSSYAGSNKSFILFTDIGMTPNNIYDYNDSDTCGDLTENECMEVLNIISTDKIESIYLNDEPEIISPTGTIDILFKRPNPEPIFCYRSEPTSSACDTVTISSVKIKISNVSNSEVYKMITISNNGQINVSN